MTIEKNLSRSEVEELFDYILSPKNERPSMKRMGELYNKFLEQNLMIPPDPSEE